MKNIVLDIFNMVFVKLEYFVSGSVVNVGNFNDENKKEYIVDWECESNSFFVDFYDKLL